jgi:acyl carrier protein
MLTEENVRSALKETIKSDKVESWSVDFDFRKAGALDSLDHVTFILHLVEDYGLTVRDEEIAPLVSIRAVLEFAARQAQQ